MKRVGASEACRRLGRLLDRVVQGERVTMTRHGEPVARMIPLTHDSTRAHKAAARIIERRRHLKRAPLADLMATIHEGHRY